MLKWFYSEVRRIGRINDMATNNRSSKYINLKRFETLIVIVAEVRSRDFNADGDHRKDGALRFEASEYGCRKTFFGFLRGKLQD